LFFLLSEPRKSFCEGDERFLDFFKNRYVSLEVRLRKRLPHVWNATMEWLNDDVFVHIDDEELAEIDREQRQFEKDLLAEIEVVREVRDRAVHGIATP
jgi:hypothetical protein